MTKEEFELQLLKYVLYFKNKLEQTDLNRAILPEGLVSKSSKLNSNPFIKFEAKYFNIRLLSNVEGLNKMLIVNPVLNSPQTKLLIMGNAKFKVLNDVMNYNPYFVEELKLGISTPMDIAIDYAKYCRKYDKFKHDQNAKI